MKEPFDSNSNSVYRGRIYISKDSLDKMTDEDWAELSRRNVRICIIDESKLNL